MTTCQIEPSWQFFSIAVKSVPQNFAPAILGSKNEEYEEYNNWNSKYHLWWHDLRALAKTNLAYVFMV
jgi:hypothetical protein